MSWYSSIFPPNLFQSYLIAAARGLMLAIPVALLFELGGWLARTYLLRRLTSVYGRDANRDPTARARRRRQLRDYTVGFARLVQNTAALLVILMLWKVDPVAIALVLVALALILREPLTDAVAGWSLLVDDALAPGDQVALPGGQAGVVAELGPRRAKLVDADGTVVWVRNSELGSLRQRPAVAPPEGA